MLPKYILSLDGGGSHLLIQLSVLACLEKDAGTPTYDLFDLIAGSSSGGLITCLISGRTMSASEIIQMVLQEKLLEKMMTVNEIADMMGYEKVSNFIDIFKKHHGFSPGAIKKRWMLSKLN